MPASASLRIITERYLGFPLRGEKQRRAFYKALQRIQRTPERVATKGMNDLTTALAMAAEDLCFLDQWEQSAKMLGNDVSPFSVLRQNIARMRIQRQRAGLKHSAEQVRDKAA